MSKCRNCSEELNGVEHDPYTCIFNLTTQIAELTIRAENAERLNKINAGIIDEYQNEIIPGFRAIAERTETHDKLLQNKAKPLYEELRIMPYCILTSRERRAYAILQEIVGEDKP